MFNKVKLLTVISTLLIAGFLATSLASYFVSRASLRSRITRNDLPLTSDNIYSEIQRDLLRPIFISSLMATDTFLRDWVIQGEQEINQVNRYLNEIKEKYGTLTSFFVSERSKNYYYAGGLLKQISETDERDIWYFRVRNMKTDYEINIDPDMANKDTMTIFINYRVYDYDGNYIGATGVGLAVSAVKSLIEDYQKRYNRSIYFVDKKGDVKISGTQFPKTVTNISQVSALAPLLKQIVSKNENHFKYQHKGRTIHMNTRFIEEFHLYLIVEQAEGTELKDIITALMINLTICGVITIVILILTGMTVKAYQKRIDTLRGIVPICSFCKQIRDDKGYWNQVEAYVSQHTDATFSPRRLPGLQREILPGSFKKPLT